MYADQDVFLYLLIKVKEADIELDFLSKGR